MLIRVLNMSLTAGVVILAVIPARLMLRRAPKIFSYVLWLAVLFRLLCPLSFSLDFSLLGMLKAPLPQQGQMQYIPENIGLMRRPEISLPGDIVTDIVNSSLPAGTPEASMNPMQGILFAGAVIWLAGVLTMIVYSMVSYGKLRIRLRGAAAEEGAGRGFTCPWPWGRKRRTISCCMNRFISEEAIRSGGPWAILPFVSTGSTRWCGLLFT